MIRITKPYQPMPGPNRDNPAHPLRKGIVLAGWTCPNCRCFNGEEKELHTECRHCGEEIPCMFCNGTGFKPSGIRCINCNGGG